VHVALLTFMLATVRTTFLGGPVKPLSHAASTNGRTSRIRFMITPTSWVNPVATSEARQNLKVQLRVSRTEMQDRLALMAFLFGESSAACCGRQRVGCRFHITRSGDNVDLR
jgi:hypothetical protein